MKSISFTRPQTEIMRGVSILLIMLHNLLHMYPGILKESESSYEPGRIRRFQEILHSGSDWLVYDVISFLGWYGVPMFIFLSGYGLSLRYDPTLCGLPAKPSAPHFSAWAFIRRNWLKLVTLMSVAVILFTTDALIDVLSQGRPYDWGRLVKTLIPLTCLNDLVQFRFNTTPGVYWYFGLAFELYLVYAFCVQGRREIWLWILTVVCFVAIPFLWEHPVIWDAVKLQTYLRSNFIGWMLPFAAGVWLARHPRIPLWVLMLMGIGSVVLFVPSLRSVWSWQLTSLYAVVIIVLVSLLFDRIPYCNRLWIWTGRLSAYLFVAHPLVRHFTRFWTFGNPDLLPRSLTCLLYVVAVFLLAMLYRWILKRFA